MKLYTETDETGLTFFYNAKDAFLSDRPTARWAFSVRDEDGFYLCFRAGWNKKDNMPIKTTEAKAAAWVATGIR